ncbi:MAG: CoA transferase [Chloroflexota bacterium]|nr:CoA transferase [Chloroflexota bacterium]
MTSAAASSETSGGALRGLKVLDFGHYIAGPLLGMLLSDQGAEVIKVERPEGDPARREPAFATWNRGKRSISLDLKTDSGRETATKLALESDVLIENFRPGVMDRLGLGYVELASANPQLVYCSLPGFGERHPDRNRQGWEPIIGASTGLYPKVEGSDEPLYSPLPIASTFAAIVSAVAVTMALCARDRNGEGQRIEVPLYDAMFTAMGRHLVKFHDQEDPDPRNQPRLPMQRQYQCADGRWVQNHGNYQRFVHQFLEAAGNPSWGPDAVADFGKPLDLETADMWVQRFSETFRQRTSLEWQEAISAAGGACTVCKTVEEWLDHPHPLEARMVAEVEDANLGRMKQPGVQVRLRGTPGAIQGRAPLLGEHNAQILEELGQSKPANPETEKTMKEALTSALQGVRVLDLCIVLAGPTCGRTLAEYGADVIKIDDPYRPYDQSGSMDVNRGKRSIMLDLKQDEGREVFFELLETADVVVENYRKGSLAKLGLDYESLKKRKPDLVYASLNAYGYDGPWSERPGWEQLAQATSGMQVRRGGRDDAPMLMPYPVNDYGTGMMGAYAVALALHERSRTGRGQSVDSGLALTAGLLQSPFFLDFEGHRREEPEGRGLRGMSAFSRLYQAADGFVYVHCQDDSARERLLQLPEFSALKGHAESSAKASLDDESLASRLTDAFSARPVSHWLNTLSEAGIAAAPNIGIGDFRDLAQVREAGLIVTREHPGQGRADHLGNTAHLTATPMRVGRPTPLLGTDADEILREIGFPAERIAALMSRGIVSVP